VGRRDRERGARLGGDDVDLIPRGARRSATENEKPSKRSVSRALLERTARRDGARHLSRDNKVWNVSQSSLERTNLAHAQLDQEIIGSLYQI
jgi:hypothetical protein